MEKKTTQISIIEDRLDELEFLQSVFEEAPDFTCQNTYRNAEDAIAFLHKSDTDIVIADIELPGKNGIECVRQIKSLRPDIHFMMYTSFDHDNKIFESLKAGASGYLLKSPKEEVILDAVRELVAGGAPMSSAIARKVTDFFFTNPKTEIKKLELLSNRENEILNLLSQGLLYKEIAAKLGIVIGTVKVHIHKIYQKLHVQNRTEAINKYLGRMPSKELES